MKNNNYGRLMLDLQGTELLPQEIELLQNSHVGGVILFSRNMVSRQQVTDLVAQIRDVSSHLLIAVDQEGGRVQRFQESFTRIPAMQKLGDFVSKMRDLDLSLIKDTGWLMASEILSCGLDISFAPVLDVDRDTSSIIGDRAFSDQPDKVVAMAQAFIEGMQEAGMAATGKHFPGHGGIVEDSHLEAPVDHRNMDELLQKDLLPFSELSPYLGGIMTAHITFPSVDNQSVGFSSYWIQQVLRRQLNFQGVVFSDDLTMKGADLVGGFREKARLALDAGCDMILVCNCPEGVSEVLEYMQKASITASDKIFKMRASNSVSWQQLIEQPRYIDVKQIVENLAKAGI